MGDSTAEILMSAKELGCRRANKQCQRYLDRVVSQYDMEKSLVERDWNNRMKILIRQKQRLLPKGFDPKKNSRPKTAWPSNGQGKSGYHMHVHSRAGPGLPIPANWTLLSSYHVNSKGERILKQNLPLDREETEVSFSPNRATSQQSSLRSRRAVSAPIIRPNSSRCLVTQLDRPSSNYTDIDNISIDLPSAIGRSNSSVIDVVHFTNEKSDCDSVRGKVFNRKTERSCSDLVSEKTEPELLSGNNSDRNFCEKGKPPMQPTRRTIAAGKSMKYGSSKTQPRRSGSAKSTSSSSSTCSSAGKVNISPSYAFLKEITQTN